MAFFKANSPFLENFHVQIRALDWFLFLFILPFYGIVSAKLVKSIFCIPAPSAKVGLECDVLI